jgi:hypothetical protein
MMTPYRTRVAKRNLRAGIEKMEGKLTVADRVYRAFRAGRPFKRDRLLKPPMALAEVCEMRDKLRLAMQKAELDPQDTAAAIVFQVALDGPPQVAVVRVGKETDVLDKMLGRYAAVTVGALFALRDHERGITRLWAHPFLISHEALTMLERALDSQEFKRALPS